VYVTDLATRESTLLCTEKQPVLRLALQGDEWLWVTTTDSALNKWPSREQASLKAFQRASSFVAGSLPFTRARACMDGSAPVSILLICFNVCSWQERIWQQSKLLAIML
jgi:WD repeat-containing protein 48